MDYAATYCLICGSYSPALLLLVQPASSGSALTLTQWVLGGAAVAYSIGTEG
eukprot:SAG11_NODE_7814_length_1093_cov_0.756539_3_plen_51_part_01